MILSVRRYWLVEMYFLTIIYHFTNLIILLVIHFLQHTTHLILLLYLVMLICVLCLLLPILIVVLKFLFIVNLHRLTRTCTLLFFFSLKKFVHLVQDNSSITIFDCLQC